MSNNENSSLLFPTGNRESLKVTTEEFISDQISHPNQVTQVNTYVNTSKILTIPADVNKSWKCIDDAIITETSRELFSADLIDSDINSNNNDIITINTNDNCMCELSLLDGQKILSIFDTGSTVNLISAEIVKNNEYLSSLPVYKCCQFTIRNTSTSVVADSFIEVCFKINDNLVLRTTALIVPDFGNVKFLLSTKSMSELQTRIDIASKKIIMKKNSFIFILTYFLKLKPNESKTIQI